MAPRSLNPRAAENVANRLSGGKGPEPPRRNVLLAFLAGAIGGLVALFPFGAGLLTFLDPLLRKKDTSEEGLRLRVGRLENLPADGTPVQAPVIADLTDAWNREPNQPIGAVYLRRIGDSVVAFNAICPHAGCFIGFDEGRGCFQCPCHTSSFTLEGDRMLPSPSPRDLDPLEVDEELLAETGDIWIHFVNFYPGKPTREIKA
jgi:menaquinol-cytochrome c reductase iron-sulfur subunit